MVLQTRVGEKSWAGREGLRQPEHNRCPQTCEEENKDIHVYPFEYPFWRHQDTFLTAVTIADAEGVCPAVPAQQHWAALWMCLGCQAGPTRAV